MLIPDKEGHYWYDDRRIIDYHAFVDGFHRIVEVFTTEDDKKYLGVFEWDDLNDIEKAYAKKWGWDLSKISDT